MNGRGQLGDFLQVRRSQLRPADVGLPDYGDRRRVAGLRREELALLAGVSASYYTRLEQGQSTGASPEILDALAQALRLDEAERKHLHDLADAARQRPTARRPRPEHASAAALTLLRTLTDVPALITGRRSDVLAWNPLGHALFASHLDPTSPGRPADRPSLPRMTFLDPHTRELYGADWDAKARASVSYLRLAAGRHPNDALLSSLIGELIVKSPEFSTMWSDHRVHPCDLATYELRHPLVGTLTVDVQILDIPQDEERYLSLALAEPGTTSHEALALLARITADSAPREGTDVSDGRAARVGRGSSAT